MQSVPAREEVPAAGLEARRSLRLREGAREAGRQLERDPRVLHLPRGSDGTLPVPGAPLRRGRRARRLQVQAPFCHDRGTGRHGVRREIQKAGDPAREKEED